MITKKVPNNPTPKKRIVILGLTMPRHKKTVFGCAKDGKTLSIPARSDLPTFRMKTAAWPGVNLGAV